VLLPELLLVLLLPLLLLLLLLLLVLELLPLVDEPPDEALLLAIDELDE
jgi:hypothetical protein